MLFRILLVEEQAFRPAVLALKTTRAFSPGDETSIFETRCNDSRHRNANMFA
jgi:hypothetical protein